jgi:Arc/MetJ-type ribon-helix-helix transcriptional regulator
MTKPVTISLSDELRAIAVKRAEEEGFESLDAYIGALIEEDRRDMVATGWLLERLEEGLKSGPSSPLTRDKIEQLIAEGIARASR